MRAVGLIYGPHLHHLDHLAPLCCLMEIPLIVTEENIALLAERYYPHLEVILTTYLSIFEIPLTHVISSLPKALFEEIFFLPRLLGRALHPIWVPHGNSDKDHLEGLRGEQAALLYGPQMVDRLKEKGIFAQLESSLLLGNYRYAYYLENQQQLPQVEKPSILLAPTWDDSVRSPSFEILLSSLVDKLPSTLALLIKLHPNLDAYEVEKWITAYGGHPDVHFIGEEPLIYPLLHRSALYIGDSSSIGYDFLTFNRPMFFLPSTKSYTSLRTCGLSLTTEDYPHIYEKIAQAGAQAELSPIRKQLYNYAFGQERSLPTLRRELHHFICG